MRAALGFAGVHVLLIAAGVAALHALGLVGRGARGALAAAGPAYLTGVAVVITALIVLLVVGIPVNLVTFVAVALAAAGAGVVIARRRAAVAAPEDHGSPEPLERKIAWGLALAVAAYFAIGFGALSQSPVVVDNVGIWGPKALALFHFDHLPEDVFQGEYGKNDYPVLQPLLESQIYRAMARHDIGFINVELWLLFGCALWSAAWLLAPGRRPLAWAPVLALLALTPGAAALIKLGYADVTVALFGGLGALALGLFVERRRPGHLMLGAIMLGAAANAKNEGLLAGVICVIAAAAVLARDPSRPAVRTFLPALGVWLAMALPWRIWVAASGVGSDDFPSLGKALDPGYLLDRTHRLREAVPALLDQLVAVEAWTWVVPLFLGVALACAVGRVAGRMASYYLISVALLLAALAWVYWASGLDIGFHLQTSVGRTVTSVVFMAALGLAHVAAAAWPLRRT